MRPLDDLPAEVCRDLLGVLADIDDTLSSDGRLPAAAYAMLEELTQAGLIVIPVTGRPAGWCDMIARFWPVAGIVGENGAFAFRYDHAARKMRRWFATAHETRIADRTRLAALGERILAAVPGCAIASDQLYREADLAIDFREDVAPLLDESIARIVAMFVAEGATAKVSSIHVNGWFGDYDKLTTTRQFLADCFGIDVCADRERFVFCGDSPNDAPMFGFFPHSCGVANVLDFAGKLPAAPRYVAPSRGGAGFVEIGRMILAAGLPTLVGKRMGRG